MHLCYIDESGDSQTLTSVTCDLQPLLVICGLFIDADLVKPLTADFLNLKLKYFPKRFSSITHDLDILIDEIKGSDIRYIIRTNSVSSTIVQGHFRYIDGIFDLIKKYDVKIVGRVWIKGINRPISDTSVYTITIQGIAKQFQQYLEQNNSEGMIIADFRDPKRNSHVAHSIYTQKHKKKTGGDAYPRINETATFGISDNHACLQIADVLCSTILYPASGRTYCYPTIRGVHTHSSYNAIKHRYKRRLMHMQFQYTDVSGLCRGITVLDLLNHRTARDLFV